ncbi:hypothetical protein [Streptomyces sp. NPDC005953]|uniref:hypothetical protein n=1 Tax=Streptomyces sp. NPDC005953 TaxID=3156719 RepID=UPI0033EED360
MPENTPPAQQQARLHFPSVVIRNASELRLADAGVVVVGKPDAGSAFLIDGINCAVSREDPVVIRPFGPGSEGGTVTLTLVCQSILGVNTDASKAGPDA